MRHKLGCRIMGRWCSYECGAVRGLLGQRRSNWKSSARYQSGPFSSVLDFTKHHMRQRQACWRFLVCSVASAIKMSIRQVGFGGGDLHPQLWFGVVVKTCQVPRCHELRTAVRMSPTICNASSSVACVFEHDGKRRCRRR